MSVKCEEPIDELTVQVWLLYHHQNFKYCTLFVSGTELRTDRQTDDPITRCPWRTFQIGGIKILYNLYFVIEHAFFVKFGNKIALLVFCKTVTMGDWVPVDLSPQPLTSNSPSSPFPPTPPRIRHLLIISALS